jgi:uncharacterized protein (TIGR02594 family)
MTAPLPPAYAWLAAEPGPRMLVEGLKTYGTTELPGRGSNPIILEWAREVGLGRVYTADAVAWCGLWMAVVARRAGKPVPANPLWALNWARWGQDGGQPELGDVLVFVRNYTEGGVKRVGGHVALYLGEDKTSYHVLGGNQGDAVTITRIAKDRLRACRELYQVGKPANVRPVILASTGKLSVNEA